MPKVITKGSGNYNQRITVEVNTATSADLDKNGAQLEVWDSANSYDLWAAYSAEPSRPGGAEYFTEERRVVEDRALFRVRHSSLSTVIDPATHRIVYGGKTWNIQRAFDPDGTRFEIHIETHIIQ